MIKQTTVVVARHFTQPEQYSLPEIRSGMGQGLEMAPNTWLAVETANAPNAMPQARDAKRKWTGLIHRRANPIANDRTNAQITVPPMKLPKKTKTDHADSFDIPNAVALPRESQNAISHGFASEIAIPLRKAPLSYRRAWAAARMGEAEKAFRREDHARKTSSNEPILPRAICEAGL
jgi:hypothetical protein